MSKVREITLKRHPVKNVPLKPGDTVRAQIKIKEGGKERIQIFEGVVLKVQGRDFTRSFTVRKISQGIGVEKTFPLASPNVVNVEIISRAKVRRARLFYLRERKGRASRLNTRKFVSPDETGQEETAKPLGGAGQEKTVKGNAAAEGVKPLSGAGRREKTAKSPDEAGREKTAGPLNETKNE